MMFSAMCELIGAWVTSSPKKPSRTRTGLCLESLEHRDLLSGGPAINVMIVPSGGPGGPNGLNSGGPNQSILAGPGYPISPTSGPTRSTSQDLATQGQTSTQIGLTGPGGGNGPSLASVAVCLGTGGPGSPTPQ